MKTPHLIELRETAQGSCRARHYRTGEAVRVDWQDGRVTGIEPEAGAGDLPWIAPALVDLQVNGYNGVDFQAFSSDPVEQLRKAAQGLRRDGCARTLLTLITAPWASLLDQVACCRAARDSDLDLRKMFFGWHIEGPFLSDERGFYGAHDPACMIDPEISHLEALRTALPRDPILLTLAPERTGSLAAIRRAVDLKFKVSLGHTNASASQIADALQNGAEAFTHLGNGCLHELDRGDNILWRVLDGPPLTAGVIPDGLHVTPPLFRLFHRLLPAQRVYWTTDAMSAAGSGPGKYRFGRLEINVGEDGIARQPGAANFAGSALSPIEGIRRGAKMLGVRWNEVWDHFSVIPMNLMGLPYGLQEGAPAAFCLLREE